MHSLQRTERSVSFEPAGRAQEGLTTDEVVVVVSAGFGTAVTETLGGVRHADLLNGLVAGVEEEGLAARLARSYESADLARLGDEAACLSGSGVGVGVQPRGTTVVHHADLAPLDNLELLPQAPLLDADTYRQVGHNAALYANGDTPSPVAIPYDEMARPKYQAVSAVWHARECQRLEEGRGVVELDVEFERR